MGKFPAEPMAILRSLVYFMSLTGPDQQTVVLREDVINAVCTSSSINYGLLASDNSKACSHQYGLHLWCPINNDNVTIIVRVTGGP